MVYIKNWTDFETAASDVYKNAPTKARYSFKFVQKTGQLVLKVTDDTTCIMYKTFSSIVLNRFEALNLRLLSQIANVKPKPRPSIPVPAGIERAGTPMRAGTPGAEGDDPMEGRERAGTPAAAQTPGGAGAGGKKKKKGKR